MTDVTSILCAIEQGDQHASAQLLPLVYSELRKLAAAKLAQEKPGQTLQATALVHEAYLRLVDVANIPHWNSRGHFFGAAAQAMRRILVEHAREKGSLKRGGDWQQRDLDQLAEADNPRIDDLLDLDEALQKLARIDSAAAQLVELRFFAGLTIDEAANLLNISPRTAKRTWAYARAWLRRQVCLDQGSTI